MAKNAPARSSDALQFHTKPYSLLFSDIRAFSELDDTQARAFFAVHLPSIARILLDAEYSAIALNTWGDAVFGVYEAPLTAVNRAFALRDYFRSLAAQNLNGYPSDFGIRIALHHAEATTYVNPVTGRKDAFGRNVNLTARIEPVVTVNEVWSTKVFYDLLQSSQHRCVSQNLGQIELVKGWGRQELLRLSMDEPPKEPRLHTPADRLVGLRGLPSVHQKIIDIIRAAKHPDGFLDIAAVAHQGIFNPNGDVNALWSEIEGLLRYRDPAKNEGVPVRLLFLDPESDVAFARETFETRPSRKSPVYTRGVIRACLANAQEKQKSFPKNLHIRVANEMPEFFARNHNESLGHAYLSSAVGADTQVAAAHNQSPSYRSGRDHFDNYWRHRWVLLDLGKVLIKFEHGLIAANLWKKMSERGIEPLPTTKEIQDFFFEPREKQRSRNEELEIGRQEIDWLHNEYSRHFRDTISLEDFQFVWNNIFVPINSHAIALIERLQQKGILVAICSNTNRSHWEWIAERYQSLVSLANWHFLSFEMKSRKPDTDFFEKICKTTHVPAWHHMLVDDREENVNGARIAGMQGLEFDQSFQTIEQWVQESFWVSNHPWDLDDAQCRFDCRERL